MQQVLNGQIHVLGELLAPHLTVLFRFIRARIQNEHDADDIVQQVLIKVFSHLSQFRFQSSFRTWLIQIAINEVGQWRRKHSARLLLLDRAALGQQYADNRTVSPFEDYQRLETSKIIHGALAQLPERYRVLIRLRDLEDRSIAETARLLGLTVPSIKARHRRARIELRRYLSA